MKRSTMLSLLYFLLTSITSHAGPLMYVPMGTANDLLIIDLTTDTVTGRIDELENAHGLSSSPGTEFLVAGSMQPADTTKKGPAKPAQMSEAEHAAHHAGGKKKSPQAASPSYVSIVHPKHGHVMRRIDVSGLTHHTAVSPDGKLAIAVHSGAGGISVIDLEKMAVVKTLQTGLWPNYAVFTRDGALLYVSNAGNGVVSEIDTRKWTISGKIRVGKEPEHMVMSADDRFLYVANKASGTVSVIDRAAGKVGNTYTVGKKLHGIDLSDDNRWLYVASKGENTVSKIDLQTGRITVADLAPAPYHLAYIRGLNKLYVSSRKLPKIWVLEPETLRPMREIDLKKGVAHQMVMRSNP